MRIPKDPYILLSYINTKLRDEYHNLEDLCISLNVDRIELETVLSGIDYAYVRDLNRFTAVL
ncbi:MAG: hypothetical protein K0R46_3171 [Herbinix sp.]|jgi:hypothetical protein|nr:hypothetical protein [Herbinix sp.]